MNVRDSQKDKLAANGWVVGDAADFLGLSAEDEAYIELRLTLADGLKTRRQSKGLSPVGLAQAMKSSQSRATTMEAGDPSVSIDLWVKSRLRLGTAHRQ
jgi:hypothetical protein